ncbi:MAG: hypothetical protein K0S01_1717 [Herbinix sp.]|nr:hypothetical protein [Herbinix sp.]
MRKRWRYITSILMIMAMLLTGCTTSQENQTKSNTSGTTTAQTETIATSSSVVVDKEFTANDLDVGYEDSTSTHITLEGSDIVVSGDGATARDGVVTISSKGTYVIAGTLQNGQIIVDAGDADKVQLVLNGISVTCSDNAPIYIKNADKTFITLGDGTINNLIDGKEYVQSDDNNVDGVIYSKSDLTINGDGTLNITGNYKHGIASKDDLVITGGTYNITAVKDAINGKDSVKIKDGTFILSATLGNGIQSKNGDDTTKGFVYIYGGTITITKCMEGIEGTAIIIEGGTIDIIAEDDGLNATSGTSDTTEVTTMDTVAETLPEALPVATTDADSSATTEETTDQAGFIAPGKGEFGGGGGMFEVDTNAYISITGGMVTIDALGDGIDSNGTLYISGGNIYVSGPTNSGNGGLDYNGTAEITGGIIIVAGSSGMAQGFSDTSRQYSLLYNFTTTVEAGMEVKLTDQEGKVVANYTPNKLYQSVVISTPELTKDETYTLTAGSQTADITLSSIVTSNGQQGMMGQGNQVRQGIQRGQGAQPGKDGMARPGAGNVTEGTENPNNNLVE